MTSLKEPLPFPPLGLWRVRRVVVAGKGEDFKNRQAAFFWSFLDEGAIFPGYQWIKIASLLDGGNLLFNDFRSGSHMGIEDIIRNKREEIFRLAARYGARNLRVFGSVARGEAGPDSDLDLLIDLEKGRSLLDHVALAQDLEDLLGRHVDVVTEKALHWHIRDRVLSEAVPL